MKTMKTLAILTAVTLAGCTLSSGDTYLGVGSYVKHHSQNSTFTEGFDNMNISVDQEVHKKPLKYAEMVTSVGVGTNINSYGKRSFNARATYQACRKNNANIRYCLGVALGCATGYKKQTGLACTPFPAAVGTIDHDSGVGIGLISTPDYRRKNVIGFEGITARFNVKKIYQNFIKRWR